MTETQEIPKVYKVVRVDNGELKSVYAGNCTTNILRDFRGNTQGVIYKEGQISYAPRGQKGLFVFMSLKEAKAFAIESREMGILEIYEAIPLGEEQIRAGFDTSALYPALILDKKVWSEDEPLDVFEEWEDVTRDCDLYWQTDIAGWYYVDALHGGDWVVSISVKSGRVWKNSKRENYRVVSVTGPDFDYFRVEKKV